LLVILITKDGGVRLHLVEQFQHHCRHSAKMPGPEASAQIVGQTGHLDLGHGLGIRRVHFVYARHEQEVGPRITQFLRIGFRRSRIDAEILRRTELQRIDEDADDNAPRPPPRFRHQRQMARVEIAHGRHQSDRVTVMTPRPDSLTQR